MLMTNSQVVDVNFIQHQPEGAETRNLAVHPQDVQEGHIRVLQLAQIHRSRPGVGEHGGLNGDNFVEICLGQGSLDGPSHVFVAAVPGAGCWVLGSLCVPGSAAWRSRASSTSERRTYRGRMESGCIASFLAGLAGPAGLAARAADCSASCATAGANGGTVGKIEALGIRSSITFA